MLDGRDCRLPILRLPGAAIVVRPAIIAHAKLTITGVPARATFPIEVKIVACQFGRGIEPLVQTATPVEQTIRIEKP